MKRILFALLLFAGTASADGLITLDEPTANQRQIPIDLVLAADGVTKAVGLAGSITGAECRLYRPGSTGANCLGVFLEQEQGGYGYYPTAAEVDAIGMYNIYIKESTTDLFHGTFQVTSADLNYSGVVFAISGKDVTLDPLTRPAITDVLIHRAITFDNGFSACIETYTAGGVATLYSTPLGTIVPNDTKYTIGGTCKTVMVLARPGSIRADSFVPDALSGTAFAQAAADKVWLSAARTLTALGSNVINAAALAADAVNEIAAGVSTYYDGTAQSVSTGGITLAATESYADNSLNDNNSVIVVSATTGKGQTQCICASAGDSFVLCNKWATVPTGTVLYRVKPTPACNPKKYPQAR